MEGAAGRGTPPEEERGSLEAICALVRARLRARRVAIWRLHSGDADVSPAAMVERADVPSTAERGPQWIGTPLAELPPLERAVREQRPVACEEARTAGGRMDELAGDFGVGSLWCAPLLLGDVVGVLLVEPAEAAPSGADPVLDELASAASGLLAARRAERERARTELFLELAEAAGRPGELGATLARACEGLARLLAVPRASVFLVEDGRLVPRMSRRGDGSVDPVAWREFRKATVPPLLEEVLVDGRPRQAGLPGTPTVPRWWAETFEVAALLAVPLQDASGRLGVLVLDAPVPRRFSDAHVRLASAAASQLAAVVRHAREVAEREERLVRAEAERELLELAARSASAEEAAEAVAVACRRVLDADVAAVGVLDDPPPSGRGAGVVLRSAGADPAARRALEEQVAGTLARGPAALPTGPTLREAGDSEGMPPGPPGWTSLGLLPLRSGGRLLGLAAIASLGGPRRWHRRDRDLATTLALHGALVVDNAALRARERYQATHDALTGLANRSSFREHLEVAVARARREGGRVAVLLADLDRFKDVNDTLGHHRGDALLEVVGSRLRTAVRDADVAARLGGDEFAVLCTTSASPEGALAVAQRVAEVLRGPVVLDGLPLEVDASVGVALFPDHGTDAESLLKHADVAMYAAKRARGGAALYAAGTDGNSADRLVLVAELRRALAEGELVLYYQPKVDLGDGAVVGVEALVRWRHPRLGLLLPGDFLPAAEAAGLMGELGTYVLREALAQAARWRRDGLDVPVAVNVAARELADPRFPERVHELLGAAGVEASRLVLELTESAVMADRAQGCAALARLRALGVRVSLDDFGTGYSSLSYLESLPLDEVKIDRSFLAASLAGPRAHVVRSIVELGHHLGLEVVAEGVEAPEGPARLARLGCDMVQGFACAAPMPPAELERWLRRPRATAVVLVGRARTSHPRVRRPRAGRGGGPSVDGVAASG